MYVSGQLVQSLETFLQWAGGICEGNDDLEEKEQYKET